MEIGILGFWMLEKLDITASTPSIWCIWLYYGPHYKLTISFIKQDGHNRLYQQLITSPLK